VCALDCPDCCGLLVTVENGRGVKLRGGRVTTVIVRAECYSGFKTDERPLRFQLGARWYDPDAIYFRVHAGDGNLVKSCGQVIKQGA